ncbi:GntR family transcriptional regulator [Streptomyces sp. NPDC088141]|uniref:GntR family transcriptional regulator n=1 Tax=unclassified Streptomyces TaxID=2593676 RepID=UPI003437B7CF
MVTAIRDRITAGHYVPGARLRLNELQGYYTGYSGAELRPALDQLATTDLVNGRWWVADHRPGDHAVRRTQNLLAAMIDHGAYPPGTELPTRTELATILLANQVTLSRAIELLAVEGVLLLSGNSRPRALPRPRCGSSWVGLPPDFADVLRALPQGRSSGAAHSRNAIRGICDTARERWRSGICLPADAMTLQETLQGDILCRLVLSAYEQVADRPAGGYPRLRSAAARAMACAHLPTVAPLHERLFRFTVLATALADLADELASRPARHHTTGML